jgi:hypothetical protein
VIRESARPPSQPLGTAQPSAENGVRPPGQLVDDLATALESGDDQVLRVHCRLLFTIATREAGGGEPSAWSRRRSLSRVPNPGALMPFGGWRLGCRGGGRLTSGRHTRRRQDVAPRNGLAPRSCAQQVSHSAQVERAGVFHAEREEVGDAADQDTVGSSRTASRTLRRGSGATVTERIPRGDSTERCRGVAVSETKSLRLSPDLARLRVATVS